MFNPDGNTFASSHGDTVKIWSIDDGHKPIATLDCSGDDQRCAAYFSLGGQQYMITGSSRGVARVWDLQTNICVRKLDGISVGVVDCATDDTTPVLVTVSRDHTISFLDATTYESRYGNINFGLGEARGFAYVEVEGKRSLVISFGDRIAIMEMKEDPVKSPPTMEEAQEC